MKKITTIIAGIILMSLSFSSCTKEEKQTISEVEFTLNVSDFVVKTDGFTKLKSESSFGFTHKYPTNVDVVFTSNSTGLVYPFNTGNDQLDEYIFMLEPGDYAIDIDASTLNALNPTMSFNVGEPSVIVLGSGSQIDITVNLTCSLLLIRDSDDVINILEMRDEVGSPNGDTLFLDGLFESYAYFVIANFGVEQWVYVEKFNTNSLFIPLEDFGNGIVVLIDVYDTYVPEQNTLFITPIFPQADTTLLL